MPETQTCSHKNFASNGCSCFFKSIVCHKNKVLLHSTSSSDLLAGLFEPDERHRLPHRCQMLPRRCEAVGLYRTSLSFASRTLGTAVTGSADNATPCHKLPRLCFSDRVNELLAKQGGKSLNRWMDNQEVCRQLNISPRTLQTLRDNGTLINHKVFYRPEDVSRIVKPVERKLADKAV